MTPGQFFFDSWVPGVVLWTTLYISDYACTIAAARLYRQGVNEHLVFEGGFELTPYFQKDIDSLRLVSPRFVLALVATAAALIFVWYAVRKLPGAEPGYQIALGGLVLIQCAVHVRHFRNLFLFRSVRRGALVGRVTFPLAHRLRASAAEALSFAGMYLLFSIVLGSWFFLGGALSSLSLARTHRALARRHDVGPRPP